MEKKREIFAKRAICQECGTLNRFDIVHTGNILTSGLLMKNVPGIYFLNVTLQKSQKSGIVTFCLESCFFFSFVRNGPKTIDPRIPTMPGRSTSDYHRPGGWGGGSGITSLHYELAGMHEKRVAVGVPFFGHFEPIQKRTAFFN